MPDQIIFSYLMDEENMLFGRPLPFVKDYPGGLDDALKRYYPGAELSPVQKSRLNFCITGIPAANSVCCAKFKRASLKACSLGALYFVFRIYPTKQDFAINLPGQFRYNQPEISIRAFIADSLYCHDNFKKDALMIFDGVQLKGKSYFN